MTTSKWILFIVFTICSAGAVCVCPHVIYHAESVKARRIAERLQAFLWGVSCGILGHLLYGIIAR